MPFEKFSKGETCQLLQVSFSPKIAKGKVLPFQHHLYCVSVQTERPTSVYCWFSRSFSLECADLNAGKAFLWLFCILWLIVLGSLDLIGGSPAREKC